METDHIRVIPLLETLKLRYHRKYVKKNEARSTAKLRVHQKVSSPEAKANPISCWTSTVIFFSPILKLNFNDQSGGSVDSLGAF